MCFVVEIKEGDGEERFFKSKCQELHGQHCSSQLKCSVNHLNGNGHPSELMINRD
jgi:hypothetical protein